MTPYPHNITERARELRRRQTSAEELLWQHLRRHRIGKYIVDFYCAELNLVVELEGDIHKKSLQREYDKRRFDEFEILGLSVFRVRNEDVFENIEEVLNRILTLSLAPSPTCGRGMSRSDKERVREQDRQFKSK